MPLVNIRRVSSRLAVLSLAALSMLLTVEWTPVRSAGIQITPLDDYEQWQDARSQKESTAASAFRLPPGFQITMVRSARQDEDSWISLRFDPQGRLIVAKEKKGLLRFTLSADNQSVVRSDLINDTLPEVRGLVFVGNDLFANVNNHNQKPRTMEAGLYRLRSAKADGVFDEVKLMGPPTRTGGHGRNDITLGPDGMIYMMHGDSVSVPSGALRLPPPADGLLPGDDRTHGHLIRTDVDGKRWEVVAHGLRNPFGIAFNADGEAFTYDADAEHDMGSPWYRPTRLRHLVSGADYGWRNVTGSWPPYYPDHADEPPNTFDIGKGSPTALEFGTRSHFPERYRKALFILDWTYGRIIAAHLTPEGASYSVEAETFLRGRPANVTDLDFGPDGALYFVTGGRGTQSGLYRVAYTNNHAVASTTETKNIPQDIAAANARALRRSLEVFHHGPVPDAIDAIWPHLNHADPWIQHAARVAIEHQPLLDWQDRALTETDATRAWAALLSLARVGKPAVVPSVLVRALSLDWRLAADKPAALRVIELCLQRIEKPDPRLAVETLTALDRAFPRADDAVNRELAQLLCGLGAGGMPPRIMPLIDRAQSQEERMHYLFLLRNVKDGWTPELRRRYFVELARMDRYRGGAGLPKFIAQIRNEALAATPTGEKIAMQNILDASGSSHTEEPVAPRPFVKHWTVAELEAGAADTGKRDMERGRRMFHAAMCGRCHTFGAEGRPFGPDLTHLAGRFSRPDLLTAINEPSREVSEGVRNVIITTKDGETHTGQVVMEGDYRSTTLKLATDPAQPFKFIEIPKADILSHRESEASPMPEGLLDSLSREEILDLLAWLQGGGDRRRVIDARAID